MLKRMVITAIKGYQTGISPFFPTRCRFYPSCSEYTIDAIRNYGLAKGLIKASLRVLKCNPLHPGGYDPA